MLFLDSFFWLDLILKRPAEVAQLVEHGTENAGVDSSILSLGTCSRPRQQALRAEVAQW